MGDGGIVVQSLAAKKGALGVANTPTHLVPAAPSQGLKPPEIEAEYSPTVRRLRMSGAGRPLSHMSSWRARWQRYISELPNMRCLLYTTG
jgi:hypothetical protein